MVDKDVEIGNPQFIGRMGSWMHSITLKKDGFNIHRLSAGHTLINVVDEDTVIVSYGTKLDEMLSAREKS